HTPAFGCEPAGLRGLLQCLLRNAGLTFLVGVEAREMLSDDFLGRIAFDALCAGVPTGYAAVRIDPVDRIVDDRLDELLVSSGGEGRSPRGTRLVARHAAPPLSG